MKRYPKASSYLCILTLVLAMLAMPALAEQATFAGGTGSAEDPFQIATPSQLAAVGDDLSACYILTADIDLAGIDPWVPIGYVDLNAADEAAMMANGFAGIFDGNGHTVSNINVNTPDTMAIGLFGLTAPDSIVRNLTVENVDVNGYMSVGGVIGYHLGVADDLTLKGENTIAGINCVGGIVGGNDYGAMRNCTVENARVYALGDNSFPDGRIIQDDMAQCAGLIVGGSFGGIIEDCTAAGTVIAEGNEPLGLGGIGGCLAYMDTIANCTADVTIAAPNNAHAVGGLCGYAGTGDAESPALIDSCTAHISFDLPGATHVGGLVGTGLYYMGMETAFEIHDSTVSGAINGAITPGTVAGRAEGSTIVSCDADVMMDGEAGTAQIGTTDRMYESADQ